MPEISSFHVGPKIIFGNGSIMQLPEEIKIHGKKVFIVIDSAIGESPRLFDKLKKEGVEFVLFNSVEPEPWTETVDMAAQSLKKNSCDCVVGIGGGSAMDVAKAAAALACNPGKARDYQGLNLLKKPALPKLMVPTTAGTGSEATFTSVLSLKETGTKAGINSPYLFPETAVLDPELTLGLPAFQTATTGMDALTHAIEAYTSKNASLLSDMIAEKAIRLIAGSLQRAVNDGSDITARSDMLMAALLGGIALANAGVGAVHALSYPLGGKFRIPHGVANGLLLPYVMDFNAPDCARKYAETAVILGEGDPSENINILSRKAVYAVRKLASEIKAPLKLSELGVKKEWFENMAEAAMRVSRPLENNPRKICASDAVEIYTQAL